MFPPYNLLNAPPLGGQRAPGWGLALCHLSAVRVPGMRSGAKAEVVA